MKKRLVRAETDLSAALLLDVLHRKDVLSRGGYLHLDSSSPAARFLAFWSRLIRSLRPFFCCSSSDVSTGATPSSCVSSLAFAATPSAGELERQPENASRK